MCGIAGFLHVDRLPLEAERIGERMAETDNRTAPRVDSGGTLAGVAVAGAIW